MGYQVESVVVADLITGEKVSFPQKPYALMDATRIEAMHLPADADASHDGPPPHEGRTQDIPESPLSQAFWFPDSGRPGKAAADQQYVRGASVYGQSSYN
jgi:hypothetical protein